MTTLQLNDVIKIIKTFQEDKNPPYKAYEDTYMDGWLDACNEILYAILEKYDGKLP